MNRELFVLSVTNRQTDSLTVTITAHVYFSFTVLYQAVKYNKRFLKNATSFGFCWNDIDFWTRS